MRVKLLITAVAVLITGMLAIELTPAAMAQGNSNASTGNKTTHHRRARAKGKGMHGVPHGVAECIEHLQKMAQADPLIPYEGHPQEVINNGLLWNSPKSHCSVGDNQQLRDKIVSVATAWQQKNAASVRSLLDEAKGMAPAGSDEGGAKKAAPHRRTKRKASNANAAQ
jgi:hypothetical protein